MDRFSVNPVQGVKGTTDIPGINSEEKVKVTSFLDININGNGNVVNGVPTSPRRKSRKFSWVNFTKEALPRLDNYRLSKRVKRRPSIGELYGEAIADNIQIGKLDAEQPVSAHHGIKLGWIQGVLIPCLLNIWGVMLFLRLSWVVSQSGIYQTLIIIGISAVVCVITTLSLSAISTNGEVRGGGIYFIISRSLGPEFGASVGIVFAFANAVAASMNTIGFCDSLNDLLKSFGVKIIDGGVNDTRIVGLVALVIMLIICAIGMEWESKAQNFLIVTIVAAIINFIVGTIIGPTKDVELAKGFQGFNKDVFASNWGPDYRFSENIHQNFFSVFAIFFPSVTGIQAGANISGDLKDPASAIPKGTLLSLIISMTSYAVFVLFAGGGALRDASGDVSELVNGTLLGSPMACMENFTCEYGLHNSYSVMQLMSWGPLIYAGCFAATLSTALTNLLSVPRLIQALGIDQIYPGLIYFSKGYGKAGEPYRGYVLTFFISGAFILIAQLNVIAPLISTCYLASYALINFCTFHAGFIKPLGWRPTFKYYNIWLSLAGFLCCVAIMFLIDWISSLLTFFIIFALYLIVVYRKPDVNWGSSTQAQTYKTAMRSAHQLENTEFHVKNYQPQILAIAGMPQMRPPLIDLGHLVTKQSSLMIVGDVIQQRLAYKRRLATIKEGQKWLTSRKVKAFYNIIDGYKFADGVRAMIQLSGFGKLRPNILLMGYKSDWRTSSAIELDQYFGLLHDTFSNRLGLVICRMPNNNDYSHLNLEIDPNFSTGCTSNLTPNISVTSLSGQLEDTKKVSTILHADSNLNLSALANSPSVSLTNANQPPLPNQKNFVQQISRENILFTTRNEASVPKEALDDMNYFSRKHSNGTIDVWWLYDDGGLTMLIPYIISMRSNWSSCKVRIFALAQNQIDLEAEEKSMAALLAKLRISYSSLKMLQGVEDTPKQETIEMHSRLLDGFREGRNNGAFVTEKELINLQDKTYRQLRLRELLMENSLKADLVVMSLPMPRQGSISAPLYMSWLEMLTKDMPPYILVRGNQTPVLTLYS